MQALSAKVLHAPLGYSFLHAIMWIATHTFCAYDTKTYDILNVALNVTYLCAILSVHVLFTYTVSNKADEGGMKATISI